ncbi:MAG: type IV secretion system DNA-binding domain-containing protein, partial [Thermodesulfobacteriota bacterium]
MNLDAGLGYGLSRGVFYLTPIALFFITYRVTTAVFFPEWSAVVLGAFAAFGGYRFMSKKDDSFIRGQRKSRLSEVQAMSDEIKPKDDKGFLFGGVSIPTFFKSLGMLLLGVPGSGKSLTIKHLMLQCFRGLIRGDATRGIIYDYKMEFLPFLKSIGIPSEKIILFHGNHKDSAALDVQADMENVKDAIPIGFALIPPNPKEHAPFFTNGARNLLIAVLQALYI